jgi:hypothetical protein
MCKVSRYFFLISTSLSLVGGVLGVPAAGCRQHIASVSGGSQALANPECHAWGSFRWSFRSHRARGGATRLKGKPRQIGVWFECIAGNPHESQAFVAGSGTTGFKSF